MGVAPRLPRKSSIVEVGTGTATKTFTVTNITNYKNMTANNFLVELNSIDASSSGNINWLDSYVLRFVMSSKSTISKSYDASTGALTVTISKGNAITRLGKAASYYDVKQSLGNFNYTVYAVT